VSEAVHARKPNKAASVHARLLERTKGQDFNLILSRYAMERWLYRLSISPLRDQFLLKGALLFSLWFDQPHRPTRDADFLGLGRADADALARAVAKVCDVAQDDGLIYDKSAIRVVEIREEANYAGLRVTLVATLGNARCPMQLDVGYGDAVTPAAKEETLPTLLDDQPPPRMKVYPRETVIAEKLEAMVSLGLANSRMKDYFDLLALAHEGAADPSVLSKAIAATFKRRGTALPQVLPLILTDEFANDPAKQKQWQGFLKRNRLQSGTLNKVVAEIRAFLEKPLLAAVHSS